MEDENKIYTTKELKEIFTNICKNIEEIDKVILFGSYAKNKANIGTRIPRIIPPAVPPAKSINQSKYETIPAKIETIKHKISKLKI